MFTEPRILLLLPVILPLFFAVLLLGLYKIRSVQQVVQVLAGLLHFVVCCLLLSEVMKHGFLTTQAGGWKAPFGITFIADMLSALVLFVCSFVSLAVSIFSLQGIDPDRFWFGYFPVYYIMIAGISGILLTGDIFNLYVWIEVMLISSFVLLSLGGSKAQLEGTIKYTVMNLLGSLLFLIGVGFLYRIAGTLNIAHLSQLLAEIPDKNLLYIIAALFFVSLGIKTAVFPLYFWLPASYPTPPVPVAAAFGGILAKVGFYILLRLFTHLFPNLQNSFIEIIQVVAGFTMLTAVLAAVAHHHFLKILSVHVVSQVGYLIMGLGIFSFASYAGATFFLIHILAVKANLFLIAGLTARVGGCYNVYELGEEIKRHPFLAALFLINALSLAGVPPLSGFWGKFFLIKSAIDAAYYPMAAIGLITGTLTLISMTKVWKEVFWKKREESRKSNPLRLSEKFLYYGPIILLTAFVLALSFRPDFFYTIAEDAAHQLIRPENYINKVLNP